MYKYIIKWDNKIKYYTSKCDKENDKIELENYIVNFVKKYYTQELNNSYCLITRAYNNWLRSKCIDTIQVENGYGEVETKNVIVNTINDSFIVDNESDNEKKEWNYNACSENISESLVNSIELERQQDIFFKKIKCLTYREQEIMLRAYKNNDYSDNNTRFIMRKLQKMIGVKYE
jgi:hypothetical protein